jgi:hypothetical protein
MNNTKNNGGPAFPVPLSEHQTLTSTAANGMTLRDYFAAKAMQVFCKDTDDYTSGYDGVALDAYAMADAMLQARNQ